MVLIRISLSFIVLQGTYCSLKVNFYGFPIAEPISNGKGGGLECWMQGSQCAKCVRELTNSQILAAIKKLDFDRVREGERVTNRVCVYKSLCRKG